MSTNNTNRPVRIEAIPRPVVGQVKVKIGWGPVIICDPKTASALIPLLSSCTFAETSYVDCTDMLVRRDDAVSFHMGTFKVISQEEFVMLTDQHKAKKAAEAATATAAATEDE